jgi:hypothetical protein
MIGPVILIIVAIIVLGLVFKLLKFAIVLALIVGGVVVVQRFLASNSNRRIK